MVIRDEESHERERERERLSHKDVFDRTTWRSHKFSFK